MFETHGRVLRAIADASTEDAEVEQAYRGLIEGFVEATAARIEREVAAGRSDVADPVAHRRGARVDERALLQRDARPRAVDDADRVAEALVRIWSATIYG